MGRFFQLLFITLASVKGGLGPLGRGPKSDSARVVKRQSHQFVVALLIFFFNRCLKACPAAAVRAARASGRHSIGRRELMAPFTVCLASINGTRIGWTPQHVFSVGYGLQVTRAATAWIAAQMVKLQAIGHDFYKQFIGQGVYGTVTPTVFGHAIAFVSQRSGPLPAGRGAIKPIGRNLYFGKKAGKKFTVNGQPVKIVMGHICSLIANLIKADGVWTLWQPFNILPGTATECQKESVTYG